MKHQSNSMSINIVNETTQVQHLPCAALSRHGVPVDVVTYYPQPLLHMHMAVLPNTRHYISS